MKIISRRQLLKVLTLGAGSICVSKIEAINSNLFNADTPKVDTSIQTDYRNLKKKALQFFYQKDFRSSEAIYKSLLFNHPSDISIYDGLTRIYNAQQDYISVVNLFKDSLALNGSNVVFLDRFGRSLMRLSLADYKQEKEYLSKQEDPQPLLIISINVYIEAIDKEPNKRYLREGLLEILAGVEKKNTQLQNQHESLLELPLSLKIKSEDRVKAYRLSWEQQKLQSANNTHWDERKISELDNKKRRKLHFNEEQQNRFSEINKIKKRFYTKELHKHIENNDLEGASKSYAKIYSIDPNDTNTKGLLLKYYKQTKNHKQILSLYENERTISKTNSWGEVAYARAILKASHQEEAINMAKNILTEYSQIQDAPNKLISSIYIGLAECESIKNKFDNSREMLLDGMAKITSSSVIHSFIIRYAISHVEEDNPDKGIVILNRVLHNELQQAPSDYDSKSDDSILSMLNEVRRLEESKKKVKQNSIPQFLSRSYAAPIAKKNQTDLYRCLANIYKSKGEENNYQNTMAIAKNAK